MKNNIYYKATFMCQLIFALMLISFLIKCYNNLSFLLIYPAAIISIIAGKFLEIKVFPKTQLNKVWKGIIELLICFIPIGIVVYVIDYWPLTIPFR